MVFTLSTIVAFVAVGVSWCTLQWWMKRPLYRIGMVSNENEPYGSLRVPPQSDDQTWLVESGIRLHVESIGTGTPVIVVHGGPGMPYAKPWLGLESISDSHKFYFYHQRGCGESTRPFQRFESPNYYSNMIELDRVLGLGALVADLERIRRILGLEKLNLIGHSFGGFIATIYAAEFPEHVESMVLVSPAGVLTPPDEKRDLFQLARKQLPENKRQDFDQVKSEYFDFKNIFSKSEDELVQLNERMGTMLLAAMDAESPSEASQVRSGGWAAFAPYFSIGRAQDYRPALQRVRARTLIVQGVDDTLAREGTKSYRQIPGAQHIEIQRETPSGIAGHFIYDESPQEFASVVADFLK